MGLSPLVIQVAAKEKEITRIRSGLGGGGFPAKDHEDIHSTQLSHPSTTVLSKAQYPYKSNTVVRGQGICTVSSHHTHTLEHQEPQNTQPARPRQELEETTRKEFKSTARPSNCWRCRQASRPSLELELELSQQGVEPASQIKNKQQQATRSTITTTYPQVTSIHHIANRIARLCTEQWQWVFSLSLAQQCYANSSQGKVKEHVQLLGTDPIGSAPQHNTYIQNIKRGKYQVSTCSY